MEKLRTWILIIIVLLFVGAIGWILHDVIRYVRTERVDRTIISVESVPDSPEQKEAIGVYTEFGFRKEMLVLDCYSPQETGTDEADEEIALNCRREVSNTSEYLSYESGDALLRERIEVLGPQVSLFYSAPMINGIGVDDITIEDPENECGGGKERCFEHIKLASESATSLQSNWIQLSRHQVDRRRVVLFVLNDAAPENLTVDFQASESSGYANSNITVDPFTINGLPNGLQVYMLTLPEGVRTTGITGNLVVERTPRLPEQQVRVDTFPLYIE